MERLVIYDANKLDCSGFYTLGNHHRDFVVGERDHPLDLSTADETTTIAIIFVSSRVNRRILARMPHLRLIVTLSVGTDHIDLKECAARGITVCNTPAYGEQTVAEYALGLMLSLARRLPEATSRLKAGQAAHADLTGRDLAGQTLTVIGTGRIGRHLIRYAQALGMTVLAVDPFPNEATAHQLGFRYVGLHDGLRQADIVSLHAPLTPDTKHLLNRRSLSLLKPGALVINTARGGLIDTTALLHALHTGHLGGVALDVIEGEEYLGGAIETQVLASGHVNQEVVRDIAEHEALLKLPNVILTNHNAYNTTQAHTRMVQGGIEAVTSFLAHQPINIVKA